MREKTSGNMDGALWPPPVEVNKSTYALSFLLGAPGRWRLAFSRTVLKSGCGCEDGLRKKNNSRAGYFWLRLLDELNAAYRPPHPSHSPRLWPCMPVSQTLAALNVLRTSLAWARAVAAANRAMLNGAIRDGCSLSRRRASNWAEAAASE